MRVKACVMVALLVVALVMPSAAYAYYNFGTVSVSLGAAALTVKANSTVSTSVMVSPSSDDQTLGCGMAKCPQVCSTEGAIAAGYNCFDVNGQCTCAGTAYSTYYPELSASSSNSGVATASVSGGTLTISGHSAGTATITVSASLRQWTSSETTVQVEVTADTTGGSENSSGSEGSQGAVSPSADVGGSDVALTSGVAIPQEATVSDSRDDQLNEMTIETVAGTVYIVECNSFLNTADELRKIVGTNNQMVFWSGASSDQPVYSWTFTGDTLDAESPYLTFDPTITISALGTGYVANIMQQARDGLVCDFAHSGELAGSASVYVRVSDTFADGTELGLFCFDEQQNQFVAVESGLKVAGGYASFEIDHCSTWALSTDDLTAYQVEEVNTPGAIAVSKQDSIGENAGLPVVPLVIAGIVIVVVACICVIAVRRARAARRARATSECAVSATPADADTLAQTEQTEKRVQARAKRDEN